MESTEAKLLSKYNITTLFPAQWPAEKDLDSDSDSDSGAGAAAGAPRITPAQPIRRSKSRYSVLESGGSFRRSVPGAEKTREGVENLVQKDEYDPLGSYPSVVQVLRQRGLPVEEDVKLRNRFLLSSTTFSPSMFLSQVHSAASTDDLLQGLDFLSRSIEKKSASLKVLVESNFERFVGAKATIDRVYNEMRDVGKEADAPNSPGRKGGHLRATSGSSFSARRGSGSTPLSPGTVKPVPNDKKKNALLKESEYGVQGIKVPLTEVAVKAEEVWGPALGGREKEETLKAILTSVEKHRGLFEVGAAIQDAIRRKDHEAIVEEYTRARKFAEDARYIVVQANSKRAPLEDAEIHLIIVTARMWADVESQIESFKRDAWKRLAATHFKKQEGITGEAKSTEHMDLISIMLELGVEDNPIWVWLLSRHEYLKYRVVHTCDRARVEIEILRRHLGNGEKPNLRMLSKHLRSVPTNNSLSVDPAKLDSGKVIDFWEHVHASMTTLLSSNGGILSEILDYWDIAQSFIDGRAQRSLPMGFNNQSSVHHKLTPANIGELEKGLAEVVNVIREFLLAFFSEPPVDDVSALFSPAPNTPTPTTPRTPMSALLSPAGGRFPRFDPNNVPPPSPTRGETWEKYAFWPPNSNALSGSHYLSKTLLLIGLAANEMASLRITQAGPSGGLDENLRSLVGGVRERCVQAVCAAWNTDAENLKVLEDWTRDPDRRDITNMPSRFLAVQTFLLSNLQKIMYVTGGESGGGGGARGGTDVVVPPSGKLLQMVRSQFVTSLYRTLSGMVECAEKGRRALGPDFEVKGDDLTVAEDEWSSATTVDASKQSVRLLLTLSNMSTFSTETTPHLLTTLESLFSISLPEESSRIRDVLSQLDAQLFRSYTKPHTTRIASIIEAGIFSPGWAPPPPPGKGVAAREPSPYVMEVLLGLVIVHTEVISTSPSLIPRILRSLFESTTSSLITTFSSPSLPRFPLSSLLQATLDVEFMAQTLSSYTSEKASKTQTEIYQVLDGKTSNEARVRLQEELGALRGVLKREREGTRGAFGCFRRAGRGAK